jgi:hypothetical protein
MISPILTGYVSEAQMELRGRVILARMISEANLGQDDLDCVEFVLIDKNAWGRIKAFDPRWKNRLRDAMNPFSADEPPSPQAAKNE